MPYTHIRSLLRRKKNIKYISNTILYIYLYINRQIKLFVRCIICTEIVKVIDFYVIYHICRRHIRLYNDFFFRSNFQAPRALIKLYIRRVIRALKHNAYNKLKC